MRCAFCDWLSSDLAAGATTIPLASQPVAGENY
jgi:hypothetical protein